MKNLTFFWKISLVVAGLLTLIGAIYIGITGFYAERFFQERNQRLNADIASHIISEVKPFIDGEVTKQATDEIMHHMMAINPSIEVYLLNPEGKILTYVAPYKKVKLESVDLAPVKKFIYDEGEQYIVGNDPRNPGVNKVFSAAPITAENGAIDGYVYVILASEEYESASEYLFSSYIVKLGGQSMLIALFGAIFFGVLLIWLITKNLSGIIEAVKNFQRGEMSSRIVVNGKGGINDLAIAFNEMADTIVGNIEDLKSMENLRRELVGNVSHDLRTPLAVIHGYIETLLIKSEELTNEERNKYLTIILESTEKLKKLVNELFELSKLEAKQIVPKKEPFYIQDLINDLVLKYQVLAKEKDVIIQSSAEAQQTSTMVLADVSLIERVFQNLIDNALKFTPKHGLITLQIDNTDNNVEIRVSDNGPGIPKDQMPFIFDRYHIGDKRISLDKNNTGLGLAIVKKILEIHDASIELTSKLNHGTTFKFELPLYNSL